MTHWAIALNSLLDNMAQGRQFKADLVDQKLAAYLAPFKAYEGAQEAYYNGRDASVRSKKLKSDLDMALLQLRSQYMAMPAYKQRLSSMMRDTAVSDGMRYSNPYDSDMVRSNVNEQLRQAKLPPMFTGGGWDGVPKDLLGLYASGQGVPAYMADKSAQMQSDFSNRYPVKPSESYSYSQKEPKQATQPLSTLTWYDKPPVAPAASPVVSTPKSVVGTLLRKAQGG